MIYTPPKFNALDGGAIASGASTGAAIGAVIPIPGVGSVVGGVVGAIGGLIGSVFGAGKSVWSESSQDQKEKMAFTLLYLGIWTKKLGTASADPLLKFVYDSLKEQKAFEGREVAFNDWINANPWLRDKAYFYMGYNSDGSKVLNEDWVNRIWRWVTYNNYNPYTPDAQIIMEDKTKAAIETNNAAQAAASAQNLDLASAPKAKTLSQMTAQEIAALSPEKLAILKKAQTKTRLIYGGAGLGLIIVIIVLIYVFKKRAK